MGMTGDGLSQKGSSAVDVLPAIGKASAAPVGLAQPGVWNDWHGHIFSPQEDNALIRFWVGVGTTPEHLKQAQIAGQTPHAEEQLPEQWKTLSAVIFHGHRSATALATHWAILVDLYRDIRAYGASANDKENTTALIAAQAMERVKNLPPSTKVTGKARVSDILTWCSDQMDGWFILMDNGFKHYQNTQAGGIHPRTHLRGISSGQSHARSNRSSSSASQPVISHILTPPPPPSIGQSVGGSAPGVQDPSQPSHSSWINAAPAAEQRVTIPGNYASTAEMSRDNHVLSKSAMGVMSSKEEYLRGKALLARVQCIERLLSMQLLYFDFQSRGAHNIVSNQAISNARRVQAEETLVQLHLIDPFSINYELLLNHLEL
ncbi:hypothetical protein FRC10_006159, partial [Ceratobasidium sp. 414]